jgi:hypothetical protein
MKSMIILLCSLHAVATFGQASERSFVADPEYFADSLSIPENVSSAAIESFQKKFNNARNPRWHSTDDGSSVKFQQDNSAYHVFYNKRGKWTATIRYIEPEDLPKWVISRVKFDFKGYSIFFAQYVKTPVGGTYLVKIEKGSDWKFVRISPEVTEVLGEYVRS